MMKVKFIPRPEKRLRGAGVELDVSHCSAPPCISGNLVLCNWLPSSPCKGREGLSSSGVGLYLNLPFCVSREQERFCLEFRSKPRKELHSMEEVAAGEAKQNSSFSLEITLTFSKIQEVLGLENYPQL